MLSHHSARREVVIKMKTYEALSTECEAPDGNGVETSWQVISLKPAANTSPACLRGPAAVTGGRVDSLVADICPHHLALKQQVCVIRSPSPMCVFPG